MAAKNRIIICFLIIAIAGCYFYYLYENKKQEVVFLDVGQGDAALINLPGNNEILIDGGPGSNVLSQLSARMPIYDRSIELMILTHPHADHSAGLAEVLKRYTVKKIIWNDRNENSEPAFLAFKKAAAEEQGAEVININQDMVFNFMQGQLEIFYPEEELSKNSRDLENDLSLVALWTDLSRRKFLLMADRGAEGEKFLNQRIADKLKDVFVLKVGHHGSEYSSSEDFLSNISPEKAIISVGENKFGHPSLRIIRRLERVGVEVLRTDEEGDIVIK
ncbi:MAG TPA: MBL fold metallo-hydrolase [bacterium]|nr:MBL fold metallo-hydrolase [bacterium]